MRMRIPALVLLSLWLVPSGVEAGIFSSKKKLPKPIKMIHIRPHDAGKFAHPTKIASKRGPEWGRAHRLLDKPWKLHAGHYLLD